MFCVLYPCKGWRTGRAGQGRNTRGGVLCTVVSAVRASATPPEITWDTTDIYM